RRIELFEHGLRLPVERDHYTDPGQGERGGERDRELSPVPPKEAGPSPTPAQTEPPAAFQLCEPVVAEPAHPRCGLDLLGALGADLGVVTLVGLSAFRWRARRPHIR